MRVLTSRLSLPLCAVLVIVCLCGCPKGGTIVKTGHSRMVFVPHSVKIGDVYRFRVFSSFSYVSVRL